jgi:putative endonuclease
MSEDYRNKVGRFGEAAAKSYLEKNGYRILGGNIKLSYQELDIIAQKGDLLVFVEVKTRTSSIYGSADEAMSRDKIRMIKKAAARFLTIRKDVAYRRLRFDFIAIDIKRSEGKLKLKHYKDIV